MKDYRFFAALSYFSIFFAPFIFPIAVYFIVQDEEVRYHAKKAFISHIIPLITIVFAFITLLSGSIGPFIGLLIIFIFLNIVIYIWNIIMGIKLLL